MSKCQCFSHSVPVNSSSCTECQHFMVMGSLKAIKDLLVCRPDITLTVAWKGGQIRGLFLYSARHLKHTVEITIVKSICSLLTCLRTTMPYSPCHHMTAEGHCPSHQQNPTAWSCMSLKTALRRTTIYSVGCDVLPSPYGNVCLKPIPTMLNRLQK